MAEVARTLTQAELAIQRRPMEVIYPRDGEAYSFVDVTNERQVMDFLYDGWSFCVGEEEATALFGPPGKRMLDSNGRIRYRECALMKHNREVVAELRAMRQAAHNERLASFEESYAAEVERIGHGAGIKPLVTTNPDEVLEEKAFAERHTNNRVSLTPPATRPKKGK